MFRFFVYGFSYGLIFVCFSVCVRMGLFVFVFVCVCSCDFPVFGCMFLVFGFISVAFPFVCVYILLCVFVSVSLFALSVYTSSCMSVRPPSALAPL